MDAFVGGFGARTDASANNASADPTTVTEVQTTTVSWLGTPPASRTLTSGYVAQESQWDSATFDQDRFPLIRGATPFAPAIEDSDFTGATYIRYNTSSTNPYKYDAVTAAQAGAGTMAQDTQTPGTYVPNTALPGQIKANRFRIASALGGSVFNPAASAVGVIKIQPGRTLP